MPIFGKKFDFRNDAIPPERNRFEHLHRIVQPGVAVARTPEMSGNGTSVVFLPYPNFENKNYKKEADVKDDRNSPEPRDYNVSDNEGWLFTADGVQRFGKSPVSLLFDNPDDAGFVPNEHHPVNMIYDVLFRTVKNKQTVPTPFGTSDSDRWDLLLNGDGQRIYPAVKRPGRQFITYALVYISGNDNYVLEGGSPLGAADNDKPVVFVMTQSTLEDMLDKLDAQNAKEELLHPEITGCRFVHFFDKKIGTCPAMQQAAAAQRSTSGFGGTRRAPTPLQGSQKKNEGFGYGVYISETLSGRPAGPNDPTLDRRAAAALACNKLLPWDKVLRGHTPEECARVVGDVCSLPDSLLYHAWKSRPEFYPDQLKMKLKNPKSVNFVQAYGSQADAPAQAPDGAELPSDDGNTQYNLTAPHAFSAPPASDEAQDDDGGINPDAVRAAMEKFRSQAGSQATPGGQKPPRR
jgi:hypothetical protein